MNRTIKKQPVGRHCLREHLGVVSKDVRGKIKPGIATIRSNAGPCSCKIVKRKGKKDEL